MTRLGACVVLLVPLVAAACGSRGSTSTTRAMPPIVIDSPADGATIRTTFHVSGSASVYEATLVLELVVDGTVVTRKTITASEGAPARGTFDAVFHAPGPGRARIVAFAPSAANGLPQHQVEVHVTVTG